MFLSHGQPVGVKVKFPQAAAFGRKGMAGMIIPDIEYTDIGFALSCHHIVLGKTILGNPGKP